MNNGRKRWVSFGKNNFVGNSKSGNFLRSVGSINLCATGADLSLPYLISQHRACSKIPIRWEFLTWFLLFWNSIPIFQSLGWTWYKPECTSTMPTPSSPSPVPVPTLPLTEKKWGSKNKISDGCCWKLVSTDKEHQIRSRISKESAHWVILPAPRTIITTVRLSSTCSAVQRSGRIPSQGDHVLFHRYHQTLCLSIQR